MCETGTMSEDSEDTDEKGASWGCEKTMVEEKRAGSRKREFTVAISRC